jgi:hypothetical protein
MRIIRGLIVSLVAILVVGSAMPVSAVTQSGNGYIDVSGIVLGPPPATPPTIDNPQQNQTFTQKLNIVQGSCIQDLIVRIFRNGVFAGSALCQHDNTYTLQIDLTEGRNDLIARQYDSNNQSSPDSDTVTVYYAPPRQQPNLPDNPGTVGIPDSPGINPSGGSGTTGSTPASTAQFQLVIDYDYSFKGVTVNTPFNLPIHFSGGTAPYAISVNWGDGNPSIISRENAEQFFVDHTYSKPGTYTVRIRISDKNGNTAYLQFVLIVNGKGAEASNATLFGQPVRFEAWTYVALPSLALGAAGFVGGFFFSHKWQRLKLKHQPKAGKTDQNS